MPSPLKLLLITMLISVIRSAALASCQLSPLTPDMICGQGFGLEPNSSAYQTCVLREQDKDVARSQFDATLSTIHAELQILAKEKVKLSMQSSGLSVESILRRERELIKNLEYLKALTGC